MRAGDLYIADDPEIAAAALHARRLQDAFNRTTADEGGARRKILDELLASYGADCEIRPPLYVDYGSNITIGARTFVNCGLVALDVAPITIGEDVQIGPNVQLLTPTHPVEPEARGDRAARGDDRRRHGGGRRRGGHARPPRRCRGRGQPGPDHPLGLTPQLRRFRVRSAPPAGATRTENATCTGQGSSEIVYAW
jgi:hypothetical protein